MKEMRQEEDLVPKNGNHHQAATTVTADRRASLTDVKTSAHESEEEQDTCISDSHRTALQSARSLHETDTSVQNLADPTLTKPS